MSVNTEYEATPLLGETPNHNLHNALQSILEDHPLYDPKCQKVSRHLGHVAVLVFAGSSKYFFIPIGEKLPLSPLFITANLTAFFIWDYWSGRAILKQSLLPMTVEERAVMKKTEGSFLRKGILGVGAYAVGVLLSMPVALAAYKYNSDDEELAATLTALTGGLIPGYSLTLWSETLFRKKLQGVERELNQIRSDIITHIRAYKDVMTHRLDGSVNEQLTKWMSVAIEERPTSRCRLISEYARQCFAYSLTASMELALGFYVFSQVKSNEWMNEDLSAWIFSVGVVIAGVRLNLRGILGTSQRILNGLIGICTGRRERTLPERLRPRLTFCLRSLAFILSGLALGPTNIIWPQAFEEEWKRIYFTSTMNMSLYLLLLTSSLDIVDDVVEELIRWRGTQEEQSMLDVNRKLNRILTMFEKVALSEDFLPFFLKMPEGLQERLMMKYQLTREKIQAVLAEGSRLQSASYGSV